MGNGAQLHKAGLKDALATTGSTKCPALMPGILVDTLLRTATCSGGSVVDRPNLSIEIPKMADPTHIQNAIAPPSRHFDKENRGPSEVSG